MTNNLKSTKTELDLYDDMVKVSNEKITYIMDFNKTILLMLSTVLSVIISFYNNSNSNNNPITINVFIVTVIFFILSILFGSINLYGFFRLKRKEEIYCIKLLKAFKEGKSTDIGTEIIGSGVFFEISRILFYIFAILSLFSLATYSIFKVL